MWALSMPPWGLWPLSFLVTPLFAAAVLLAGRGLLRTFATGLVAGTTAFLGILTWAVNIQPGGMLAWPLLSLIEGIYVGIFAVIVRPVLARRWWAMPALAIGWLGQEVVRSTFPEDGFGWAQFSYAHVDGSWLTPLARIGGGHLVTLLVAFIGATLFEAWRQGRDAIAGLEGSPKDRLEAMLPHAQRPLFWLAGALFLSVLATVEPPATNGTIDVLVVQGNDLEQSDLVGRAKDVAIAQRHLELTREAIAEGGLPDVVVWPESSIDHDPWAPGGLQMRAVLEEAAALTEGRLVAGIWREGAQPDTFRNTVSLLGRDGAPVVTYDKRQLVPFGEYVPARGLWGEVGPLTAIPLDGVAGTEPTHLDLTTKDGQAVGLAVAICFETLFPSTVRSNVLGAAGAPSAGLVIATTNDASFGRGSEPAQHLAQSQLRAVETGRWVVHAAITGSSAFVDPDGVVHDATDLFVADTIRADVPIAIGPTPFLRIGDVVGTFGLVGLLVLAILRPLGGRFARRRSASPTPA